VAQALGQPYAPAAGPNNVGDSVVNGGPMPWTAAVAHFGENIQLSRHWFFYNMGQFRACVSRARPLQGGLLNAAPGSFGFRNFFLFRSL